MKILLLLLALTSGHLALAKQTELLNPHLTDFSDVESLKGQTLKVNVDITQDSQRTMAWGPDYRTPVAVCYIKSPIYKAADEIILAEAKANDEPWTTLQGKLNEMRETLVLMPAGATYKVLDAKGAFGRGRPLEASESESKILILKSFVPGLDIDLVLEGPEGVVEFGCGKLGNSFGLKTTVFGNTKSVLNMFLSKAE